MSNLAQALPARSGIAPIVLMDVLTQSGNYYFWGEMSGNFPCVLGAVPGAAVAYKAWILATQEFRFTRSLQTDSGEIQLQNLSGNTLRREVATLFASDEFTGAQFCYRLWRASAEQPTLTFMGKLTEPVIDEVLVHLKAACWFDPNNIEAMPYVFSESCQWFFGSAQCGSTSGTPCSNSLSTCSAVERFCGIISRITEYDQETLISISSKQVNRAPRF
jgi:hypothetical protein